MENLQKVKKQFVLTGFTNAFKNTDLSNSDQLDKVMRVIDFHFGRRPYVVYNKNRLMADQSYPNCYAAGWYLSVGPDTSELVVIAHGNDLKDAQANLDFAVKHTDWQECSQKV